MLKRLWLMYASDGGASMQAVFAATLTIKLHFICRKSDNRMEHYTNAELSEMHLAFGITKCNGRNVQWLYAQRYPRR
ncbi:hypothetical protein TNCV_4108481 [Trichonephila clavipes]|nr:hypothetical protein TNCV_4108481 [Trichonephila clavipes]